MNYITFDIETYSPSDLDKIDTSEFRVTTAGAYFSWLDEYVAFMEKDIGDLLEMMEKADLIIGYNQLWFDLPVLQKYTKINLLELPNYDILIEFQKVAGFRSKLDDLCKANFDNDVKTDSYEVYRHYHKQGKWLELIDYCMNDVRLTEQLFKKILNDGKIFYLDLHQKKEVTLAKPQFITKQHQAKDEAFF